MPRWQVWKGLWFSVQQHPRSLTWGQGLGLPLRYSGLLIPRWTEAEGESRKQLSERGSQNGCFPSCFNSLWGQVHCLLPGPPGPPGLLGTSLRGKEMKYSGVLEWGSKRSSKPANRIAKLSSFLLEAFGLTSDLCLRIISPKLPYRSVLTLHSPIG